MLSLCVLYAQISQYNSSSVIPWQLIQNYIPYILPFIELDTFNLAICFDYNLSSIYLPISAFSKYCIGSEADIESPNIHVQRQPNLSAHMNPEFDNRQFSINCHNLVIIMFATDCQRCFKHYQYSEMLRVCFGLLADCQVYKLRNFIL